MSRVYVVRSRVGDTLLLGDRSIRPWHFVEVPVSDMVGQLKSDVDRARLEYRVDVHLVVDGRPIPEKMESVALNTEMEDSRVHVSPPKEDQASSVSGQVKIEEP